MDHTDRDRINPVDSEGHHRVRQVACFMDLSVAVGDGSVRGLAGRCVY